MLTPQNQEYHSLTPSPTPSRLERNGSLAAYVAQYTDLRNLGTGWYQARCLRCWDADTTLTIFPRDGKGFSSALPAGNVATCPTSRRS
jgi:hypothetical protein